MNNRFQIPKKDLIIFHDNMVLDHLSNVNEASIILEDTRVLYVLDKEFYNRNDEFKSNIFNDQFEETIKSQGVIAQFSQLKEKIP